MQTFQWVDAGSVEEAARLLAATDAPGPVVAKAGGMDLIDLMKEGIVTPARVVNLQPIAALRGVRLDDNGLHLGALTTLTEIATDSGIRERYVALAEAAAHAATPQIRNAATIGGNVLQRPRSWYFRNAHFHDDGGHPGEETQQQYGAIFDNSHNSMVHASTPATALIAYGAVVHLTDAKGKSRSVALEQLLLPPDRKRDRDTAIASNEILTHITLPPLPAGTRAAYHKQTERDSYDWPICDVAVVVRTEGKKIIAASIVLGWVAPTPRRAVDSEQLLIGRELDESLATEAARAAVRGATPVASNKYKVRVLEAVVRRTLLAAGR